MHQSLIVLCLFLATVVAYTQYIPVEDYDKHQEEEGVKDYYDAPHYTYEYKVDDNKNGVFKSHRESRQGDAVSGQYSLVDADGSVRVVKYTADDKNGFQAVVTRHLPSGEQIVS